MDTGTPAVLVVEDDADIRTILADCLGEDGYRVTAAADLDAALARLAAARFDAILADASLTGAATRDPWAVPERLRLAAPDTPVVIVSAHHPALFADHAARGFAGHVAKPFEVDELLAAVRRCLGDI